ncbi:hypothetical protein BKA93DRAFT_753219 [Sparassis latifolia]
MNERLHRRHDKTVAMLISGHNWDVDYLSKSPSIPRFSFGMWKRIGILYYGCNVANSAVWPVSTDGIEGTFARDARRAGEVPANVVSEIALYGCAAYTPLARSCLDPTFENTSRRHNTDMNHDTHAKFSTKINNHDNRTARYSMMLVDERVDSWPHRRSLSSSWRQSRSGTGGTMGTEVMLLELGGDGWNRSWHDASRSCSKWTPVMYNI